MAWHPNKNAHPLAFVFTLGKPVIRRFGFGFAGLRLSATQVFAQFRGQTVFARHFLRLAFTHMKCIAVIGLDVQAQLHALLDKPCVRDNSARLFGYAAVAQW